MEQHLKFEEFWKSLTQIQRAMIATLYHAGLGSSTGSFQKAHISNTLDFVTEVSVSVSQKEFDLEKKFAATCHNFWNYVHVLFEGTKSPSISDHFGRICETIAR